MVLIAHLADIHLGHAQYNLSFREEDLYQAFEQAIEKILEEHVEVIVISGDIFDHPRPPNKAIIRFKQIIQPIYEKNIPILVVRGDHDTPKYKDRDILELISSFFTNIKHLEYKEKNAGEYHLEKNGKEYVFYGIPYFPPSYRLYLYKQIFDNIKTGNRGHNPKKIVIGHFPIKQYMFFEEAPEIGSLPDEVMYYALGHLHDRIIDRKNTSIIAYPGSIDIIDKKEIEIWKKKGKGFYITDLSGDEAYPQKINLDIRPQEIIKGEYPKILEEIHTYLNKTMTPQYNKKPMLYIEIECKRTEKNEAVDKINEITREKTQYTRINIKEKETRETILLSTTLKTEKELITQIVKDKEIASLLVDLKECLATKQDCEQIIHTLLSKKSYWTTKLGLDAQAVSDKKSNTQTVKNKLDFFLR